MLRVHVAWRAVVLIAYGRGHADDFAHATGRAHHAHGAERFVRDADIAAGHKQIRNVAAVQATVRRPVRAFVLAERRLRDELFALVFADEAGVR